MRTAALVLGLIGGIIGMFVGFFGYGWAEFGSWFVSETGIGTSQLGTPDEQQNTKIVSLAAPILGIAGGAMSGSQPLIGAILMGASAYGMYWGFGFDIFTMFPVTMCALGAVLALAGIGLGRDENIP
ncbi:MAG: hypothetical protein AAF317_02485 [Pseudomonadota bacterium]